MKIGTTDLGEFPLMLAPLENVTNSAFRAVCKRFGADVVYTEFISCEGLVRDAVKSNNKLLFDEIERPLGIQIFGKDVENMKQAARMAEEARPEFIDINFGCPVKKVALKGAGAGLLREIPLMLEITREVVKAVKTPVTVKTRLGWDESDKPIVGLAEQLQDCGIQAIAIHGRTRAQMYSGVADWSLIGEVKNNPRMRIPVIGNGDVDSAEKAMEMKNRYGIDAVMIGRGAIGNPWIFSQIKHLLQTGTNLPQPTLQERISVVLEHLHSACEKEYEKKVVLELRKHYSGYFKGIPDFKKYRMELMKFTGKQELETFFSRLQQQDIGF